PPPDSYKAVAQFGGIIDWYQEPSEYLENLSNAITPDLPIEEPDNSLSTYAYGSFGIMRGPSTLRDPISDKPSNGLDTSMYVTVESSESDMTVSENQK
nr:hypothetical protein [Tanacetum cinerariifolium]